MCEDIESSQEKESGKVLGQCARCGRAAEVEIEKNMYLCGDCYHAYGSCCVEFGGEDLWTDISWQKKK